MWRLLCVVAVASLTAAVPNGGSRHVDAGAKGQTIDLINP